MLSFYRFIIKDMLTTVLEVLALVAIILVPMAGPKKKKDALKVDSDVSHAHYAVDEEGSLVEIRGNELTNHLN